MNINNKMMLSFSNNFFNKTEIMFGLFKKNPLKDLEKKHKRLLEEAMALQRGGDIKGYALKMTEVEKVEKEMEERK